MCLRTSTRSRVLGPTSETSARTSSGPAGRGSRGCREGEVGRGPTPSRKDGVRLFLRHGPGHRLDQHDQDGRELVGRHHQDCRQLIGIHLYFECRFQNIGLNVDKILIELKSLGPHDENCRHVDLRFVMQSLFCQYLKVNILKAVFGNLTGQLVSDCVLYASSC